MRPVGFGSCQNLRQQIGHGGRFGFAFPLRACSARNSTEVQDEVERRIAAGELVSSADIKAMKAEAKNIAERSAAPSSQADALQTAHRDLGANASRDALDASGAR